MAESILNNYQQVLIWYDSKVFEFKSLFPKRTWFYCVRWNSGTFLVRCRYHSFLFLTFTIESLQRIRNISRTNILMFRKRTGTLSNAVEPCSFGSFIFVLNTQHIANKWLTQKWTFIFLSFFFLRNKNTQNVYVYGWLIWVNRFEWISFNDSLSMHFSVLPFYFISFSVETENICE